MKTIKVKIYGKVQNVNMRSMIYQQAIKLGINGYVQNDPDSVLIVNAVFQAEKEKINKMLDFIKSNPGRSKIDDVKVEDIKLERLREFSIKYH